MKNKAMVATAFCFVAAAFAAHRCDAGSCIVSGSTEREPASSVQSSAMANFEYRMLLFSCAPLGHDLYIGVPGIYIHVR